MFFVLFATAAFALDALPGTDAEALKTAEALWQFIVEKKYAAAIGPGLTLAVWALKKYDLVLFNTLKLPKVATAVDTFLDKPFVSFLLPTVAAALGGFVTALASGHSFVDALGAVYAAGSSAITTYVGLKKLGEQLNAGEAKADAVDTKAEAVAALKAAASEESKKP